VTDTGSHLPQPLYRAAQVRELDRTAIEDFGITGERLMEHAGSVVYAVMQSEWPDARRICVVCGGGNNGGDGYVVARLAHTGGLEVTVLRTGGAGARYAGTPATRLIN
jgi:Uncharacterized conserved protein